MADVMICTQSAQVLVDDGDRLEWVRAERTTAHADHPVVVEHPHLWRPLPINYPSPAAVEPAGDGEPEGSDAVTSGPASEPAARDVRAWAREQGIDVPARGHLAADVVEQYKAARSEQA